MTNATVFIAAEAAILATIEDVESSWRADDGGLTWAAGDVIGLGRSALRYIAGITGRSTTLLRIDLEDWYQGQFSGSTGAEADICGEVCRATGDELRRRGAPVTLDGLRFKAQDGSTGKSSVRDFTDLREAREYSRSRSGPGWVQVWDDEAERYPAEHGGSLYSWPFSAPIEPVGTGAWITL